MQYFDFFPQSNIHATIHHHACVVRIMVVSVRLHDYDKHVNCDCFGDIVKAIIHLINRLSINFIFCGVPI